MNYLELDGIYKHYDDFDIEVDLHISKGDFFTLLGPSGCGKTTLLRIIAGFIKPDRGRIILSGRDITNLPPRERNISIVFQNYALFPDRNVYRNITFGPESRNWNKKRISDKAENLLSITEMKKQQSRKPETLSGGEKQRVALARAIAVEPEILLLDEPLSALDVSLRNSLRNEIRKIHETTGQTTVYVTHDQEEALSLSDRICLMNKGIIEQTDTPENLYHNPSSLFAAEFIGESNRLPVISISENKIVTEAGVLSMPGRVVHKKTGEPFLFFRPECCRIVNEPGSPSPSGPKPLSAVFIGAVILKRVFLGSYYRIEAETAGGTRIVLYDYFPWITKNLNRICFTISSSDTILFKKS